MKRLLLEGGAQRGLFTQGVLDAFMEEEISFDEIDAISVGGLSAICYKSKDKYRSLELMRKYTGDPRYFSFLHYLKDKSVFGWDFIFHETMKELPIDKETYLNNPVVLKVGAFDVEGGEMKYFECKDLDDPNSYLYLRATGSLPLYTTFPRIEGHIYCDGGVGSSFALECNQKGDKTILICTQSADYRKSDKKKLSFFFKKKYQRYPKLLETYLKRPVEYNKQAEKIQEMEANKEILVIRPLKPVNVKRTETDKKKLEDLYQQGYRQGKQRALEIKKYLNE